MEKAAEETRLRGKAGETADQKILDADKEIQEQRVETQAKGRRFH